MKEIVARGQYGLFPEEVERLERKAAQARARYHSDAEYRARKQATRRRWAEEHRDELRTYNREWMRRYRAGERVSG